MKSRHVAATNLLTLAEVADYLRVSQSTIFRLVERRELPAFKVGHEWRFTMEQIDRWRTKRKIRDRKSVV